MTNIHGITGALRELQKLTGEELYAQWSGGPNGFTRLSAGSQRKWGDLAEWITEHVITFIDVTERVETLGGRAPKFQSAAESPSDHYHLADFSDSEIVDQAELFLKGAVALQEEEKRARGGVQTNADTKLVGHDSSADLRAKPQTETEVTIDALTTVLGKLLKKLLDD